jgi:AraC-like DNA-binding protein
MDFKSSILQNLENDKNTKNLTSFDEMTEWISRNMAPYETRPGTGYTGELEAKTTLLSNDEFDICLMKWSQPSESVVIGGRDSLHFVFYFDGQSEVIDPVLGRVVGRPNQFRVLSMNPGTEILSKSKRTVLQLVVPFSEIQRRARSYFEYDGALPLQFSPLVDTNTSHGRAFLSLVQYYYSLLTCDQNIFSNQMVATSSKELLISAIIGQLPHNYSKLSNISTTQNLALAVVERAEEYMQNHAEQAISIEHLAKEVACSERTLHASFKKVRLSSPLRVLRNIRLDYAKQDLTNSTSSVTEAAFKWGFSNLGRFSKFYAEKFGEKPSQTLQKNYTCMRK